LQRLGPQIQWVQSYVTGDKVYCVYVAPSEELVRKHAQEGGFPANKISEIKNVIDPTTAEKRRRQRDAGPVSTRTPAPRRCRAVAPLTLFVLPPTITSHPAASVSRQLRRPGVVASGLRPPAYDDHRRVAPMSGCLAPGVLT